MNWNKFLPYIIMGVLVIVITGLSLYIHHIRVDLKDAESNLLASQDTLREYVLKNNELLWAKRMWTMNQKILEDSLESMNINIKELEKLLDSKTATIIDLEGRVNIDTIIIEKDSIVYLSDSTYRSHFNINTEWYKISGYHYNGYTAISNLDIPLSLQVGITQNKQIWVRSENPYVTINSIYGATLSENEIKNLSKKRFTHGIQLGIGVHYGMISNKIDIGPYIGYGICFNF